MKRCNNAHRSTAVTNAENSAEGSFQRRRRVVVIVIERGGRRRCHSASRPSRRHRPAEAAEAEDSCSASLASAAASVRLLLRAVGDEPTLSARAPQHAIDSQGEASPESHQSIHHTSVQPLQVS